MIHDISHRPLSVIGFKVGAQVRLHFDQNVVKNSFNGMTQYVWDDAIIPMLGNKYTIVELRGSMIGVQSPGGDTFYFPVGALVKGKTYNHFSAPYTTLVIYSRG